LGIPLSPASKMTFDILICALTGRNMRELFCCEI
jgi:hypothetical protein